MGTSLAMYDSGIESLKKAALSVKVRSFLSSQNGDEGSELENPELSLDLQSLIDDPNFEVNEGLFPELLHDKLSQGGNGKLDYSQLGLRNGQIHQNHQNHPNHPHPHQNPNYGQRNPLAYMPQPVHGGSSFGGNSANAPQSNGSSNSSPSSSPAHPHQNQTQIHLNHPNNTPGGVKEEPMDHRLDFNANTVSSSSDPGYSSYSSNNLTSPSSTSSSSSSGGGGGNHGNGYSPQYIQGHHGNHGGHLAPTTIPGGNEGLISVKNLGFPPGSKMMMGQNGQGHHGQHHHHHQSLSKKMKNVDKASDEYKRRRERNNVAVRKSREKAKMRSRETEERVKILAKENERLQKKIDLLTEELTFLRSFFSNVGGLPEQIHREFNKHLETFQHHHIQSGIQFPSFASFKSMQ